MIGEILLSYFRDDAAWEDTIKMYIEEVACENVDCIHLA
jgi:hypothetical protein